MIECESVSQCTVCLRDQGTRDPLSISILFIGVGHQLSHVAQHSAVRIIQRYSHHHQHHGEMNRRRQCALFPEYRELAPSAQLHIFHPALHYTRH